MVPVSVLPAAGLLVALGRVLQRLVESQTFVHGFPIVKAAGDLAFSGGLAIFENLAVVFAVGVAIGFTGGAGVAALASVVGYYTLTSVLTVMTSALHLSLKIDTGVFGGILVGLLTANLYNRFKDTQLHPVLGFFSGKRLVPILATGACLGLGLILAAVWPPIQTQIEHFGTWVMGSPFGPAFYAAGKRLLIPLGLHHVYYPPFLYQFGEFTTATGQLVKGEAARYFAGDPTAGRFMASEYPLMLFGLPAAALAMFLRADKSQRKAVGGVMLAAALTSMITGITEPIEFAFIFVAPILYVFHVAAAFVSGCLTSWLDIHLGYTFSASIIDWFLGYFNQKNSFWLFAVVGPAMALTYFSVFYVLIGWLDLATPGREREDERDGASPEPMLQPAGVLQPGAAFVGRSAAVSSVTSTLANGSGRNGSCGSRTGSGTAGNGAGGRAGGRAEERTQRILAALGGRSNIRGLDACITRLRLEVESAALVNQGELKKLGAAGVLKAGAHGVQVVFGVESDSLKEKLNQLIASFEENPASSQASTTAPTPTTAQPQSQLPQSQAYPQSQSQTQLSHPQPFWSPMAGEFVEIEDVPDETFAKRILGDGFAIRPRQGVVVAPRSGEIVNVFPTGHAIGMLSDDGAEILIHVGIDTVKMHGDGFKPAVKVGDHVEQGQKLLDFSLDKILESGRSAVSPVIITNGDRYAWRASSRAGQSVGTGDPIGNLIEMTNN